MSRFFLREHASRARLREAAAAQANRREIVKALSWGQVSRRELITRWVGGYPAASAAAGATGAPMKSYADARPVDLTSGQYVFSTKCAACHGIGAAGKIGPDLAGVTRSRTHSWLASYIADPQAMKKRGDPIARALSAQYPAVSMPTLQLTDQQVQDVIRYLDRPR
jgi:mono/diheme cytochrome c family protein